MDQHVKSDNEIIAEFMGLDFSQYQSVSYFTLPIYDLSWDWLMPVVQKFRLLRINDEDQQDIHIDHCDHITRALGMVDAKEAHKLLVSGIKWYNLIKK